MEVGAQRAETAELGWQGGLDAATGPVSLGNETAALAVPAGGSQMAPTQAGQARGSAVPVPSAQQLSPQNVEPSAVHEFHGLSTIAGPPGGHRAHDGYASSLTFGHAQPAVMALGNASRGYRAQRPAGSAVPGQPRFGYQPAPTQLATHLQPRTGLQAAQAQVSLGSPGLGQAQGPQSPRRTDAMRLPCAHALPRPMQQPEDRPRQPQLQLQHQQRSPSSSGADAAGPSNPLALRDLDQGAHHRPGPLLSPQSQSSAGEDPVTTQAQQGAAGGDGPSAAELMQPEGAPLRVQGATAAAAPGTAAAPLSTAASESPGAGANDTRALPGTWVAKVGTNRICVRADSVPFLFPEYKDLHMQRSEDPGAGPPRTTVEVYYQAANQAASSGLSAASVELVAYQGNEWRLTRLGEALKGMQVSIGDRLDLWRDADGRARLAKHVSREDAGKPAPLEAADSKAAAGGSAADERPRHPPRRVAGGARAASKRAAATDGEAGDAAMADGGDGSGDDGGGSDSENSSGYLGNSDSEDAGEDAGQDAGGGQSRSRARARVRPAASHRAQDTRGPAGSDRRCRAPSAGAAMAEAQGWDVARGKSLCSSDAARFRFVTTAPMTAPGGVFHELLLSTHESEVQLVEDAPEGQGKDWKVRFVRTSPDKDTFRINSIKEMYEYFGAREGDAIVFDKLAATKYKVRYIPAAQPHEELGGRALGPPPRARRSDAAPAVGGGASPDGGSGDDADSDSTYEQEPAGGDAAGPSNAAAADGPRGGGGSGRSGGRRQTAKARGSCTDGRRAGRTVQVDVKLQPTQVDRNELQLKADDAKALFNNLLKKRLGDEKQRIPLCMVDEQRCGQKLEVPQPVLRVYRQRTWRIGNMRKWLQDRGACAGDVLRIWRGNSGVSSTIYRLSLYRAGEALAPAAAPAAAPRQRQRRGPYEDGEGSGADEASSMDVDSQAEGDGASSGDGSMEGSGQEDAAAGGAPGAADGADTEAGRDEGDGDARPHSGTHAKKLTPTDVRKGRMVLPFAMIEGDGVFAPLNKTGKLYGSSMTLIPEDNPSKRWEQVTVASYRNQNNPQLNSLGKVLTYFGVTSACEGVVLGFRRDPTDKAHKTYFVSCHLSQPASNLAPAAGGHPVPPAENRGPLPRQQHGPRGNRKRRLSDSAYGGAGAVDGVAAAGQQAAQQGAAGEQLEQHDGHAEAAAAAEAATDPSVGPGAPAAAQAAAAEGAPVVAGAGAPAAALAGAAMGPLAAPAGAEAAGAAGGAGVLAAAAAGAAPAVAALAAGAAGDAGQPPPPKLSALPAASITHLHGYLPPGVAPPAKRPGELRECGLTFHPDVVPRIERAKADWERQRLVADPRPLSHLTAREQIAVCGIDTPGRGAEPWCAAFQRNGLRSHIVCKGVANRLGLRSDCPGADLPEQPLPPRGAEVRQDPARGGLGLFATTGFKASSVIGIMESYVLPQHPNGTAFLKRGYTDLQPAVRQAFAERREAAAQGGAADEPEGVDDDEPWEFLAGSFRMPYVGHEYMAPAGSEGLPPLELHMLGYGGLLALVNDPRVNPWEERSDGNRAAASQGANCLVVPVLVRGLVLPVLVALRDIAPGEQLLRDYGTDWWRELVKPWDVLVHYKATPDALLHEAAALQRYPPPPPPAQPAATAQEEGAAGMPSNAAGHRTSSVPSVEAGMQGSCFFPPAVGPGTRARGGAGGGSAPRRAIGAAGAAAARRGHDEADYSRYGGRRRSRSRSRSGSPSSEGPSRGGGRSSRSDGGGGGCGRGRSRSPGRGPGGGAGGRNRGHSDHQDEGRGGERGQSPAPSN